MARTKGQKGTQYVSFVTLEVKTSKDLNDCPLYNKTEFNIMINALWYDDYFNSLVISDKQGNDFIFSIADMIPHNNHLKKLVVRNIKADKEAFELLCMCLKPSCLVVQTYNSTQQFNNSNQRPTALTNNQQSNNSSPLFDAFLPVLCIRFFLDEYHPFSCLIFFRMT